MANLSEKVVDEFDDTVVKIVCSENKGEIKKLVIRPIVIKYKKMWQCEKFIGNKVFHENIFDGEIADKLNDILPEFGQV